MEHRSLDIQHYVEALEGQQKEWVEYFVNYMYKTHPDLEGVISFQMPTFKLGSGNQRNYIAFFPGKNHLSLHTMDFDYIAELKEKLEKPGNGKGCVKVSYKKCFEREILMEGIEELIRRSVSSCSEDNTGT